MSNTFGRLMRPSRRMVAVSGAVVAALLMMVAVSPIATAAKAPFKVLLVVPKSGPLGFVGGIAENGTKAAANVINKQGGILGSQVEVKTVDDAGQGAKAVAAALQETSSTKYNLIHCGQFGDDGLPCSAAIKGLNVLQIPLISEKQIDDRKNYPRTFSSGGLFERSSAAMATQLKRKKVKSVAIINGDNSTGRNAGGIMGKALGKAKIKVTRTVYVPVSTADATPQVQQAQASNPQAIVMSGFTPANIPVMRARAKLGWNAPIYGDWLVAAANLGPLTEAERKGITLQVWPHMVKGSKAQRTGEFRKFSEEFFKINGPSMPLSIVAAMNTYNPLMLARAAAIKAKNNTDGTKMAKGLEKITKGSQVRGFVGTKTQVLYSKKRHSWGSIPSSWVYVKAGPSTSGYITPDK